MVPAAAKPGDFFVIGNGKSLSAVVIEAFTASPYYHAGIYVGDGMVIQANPDGVAKQPFGG